MKLVAILAMLAMRNSVEKVFERCHGVICKLTVTNTAGEFARRRLDKRERERGKKFADFPLPLPTLRHRIAIAFASFPPLNLRQPIILVSRVVTITI